MPASAERRTSATSSSAERAPDSSSCGSIPTGRSRALALPLSTRISGRAAAVNARCGPAHHPRGRQRQREREVLRHELADDHREHRRDQQRDHHRHRAGRAVRHPGRADRALQQGGQRGFGEVPDQQRGDGDADLRARELGGERADGGQHPLAAPVTAGRRPSRRRRRSRLTRENSAATNPAMHRVSSTPMASSHHGFTWRDPRKAAAAGTWAGCWAGRQVELGRHDPSHPTDPGRDRAAPAPQGGRRPTSRSAAAGPRRSRPPTARRPRPARGARPGCSRRRRCRRCARRR